LRRRIGLEIGIGRKEVRILPALDLSESGVAVECPEAIPVGSNVVLWAPSFQVAALAEVKHCTWKRSIYVLGLFFLARTTTVENDPTAPDHYEMLRLSPLADQDRPDLRAIAAVARPMLPPVTGMFVPPSWKRKRARFAEMRIGPSVLFDAVSTVLPAGESRRPGWTLR